jgi:hypothetical protein
VYVLDGDRELPVSLLWGPFAALIVGAAAARVLRHRRPALGLVASRIETETAVVALGTLAVLPVPVLVSTASGLETETFVLVCFLSLGLVVDDVTTALVAAILRRRQAQRAVGATGLPGTASASSPRT